jgi:hypothetical protein
MMEGFSGRRLTEPGDGYNAFYGIIQKFHAITGENFLWGLLVTRFELGLCWTRAWTAKT